MDLQVQGQNTEVHPRWAEMVERHSGKLVTIYPDLQRIHVTLVHSTHHVRGAEEVRLVGALPGETLTVQKSAADMGDAIHAAFRALEAEIHKHVERRRDQSRRAKR
jgi:ribosome-associated translation inhibitor RaiA